MPCLPLLFLPVFLLCAAPAWAVYKCESDGQISYSDVACRDGKPLDIYDSQSKRAGSSFQADKNKSEVQRLQRQRVGELERQEKKNIQSDVRQNQQARRQYERIQVQEQKQKKKCALLAQRKKWAEEDLRAADVKAWQKASRKSRRLSEQYAEQCPL